jgi:hypothetical protein
MAGRPITSNTPRAQQKRELMRQRREELKLEQLRINPRLLAQAVNKWRTQ